jgi:hypothetical protein
MRRRLGRNPCRRLGFPSVGGLRHGHLTAHAPEDGLAEDPSMYGRTWPAKAAETAPGDGKK